MDQPHRILWLALAVFATGSLLLPSRAAAQATTSATCADWTAVQSWSGTITATASGQSSVVSGGVTYAVTSSESTTINLTSSTNQIASASQYCNPDPTQITFGWLASGSQVTSTVSIGDQQVATYLCSLINPQSGEQSVTETDSFIGGTPASPNAVLSLKFSNQTSGIYNIAFGEIVNLMENIAFTANGCGDVGSSQTLNTPYGTTTGAVASPSGLGALPSDVPLPSTLSALSGSQTFQGFSAVTGAATTWTVTWNLFPTDAFDVLITIPGYSTWRPMAGRSETDIGNTLTIQAQVISKSTGQPVNVNPDQWTFSLKGFSSEPGVTLNWPPQDQVLGLPDLDFKDSLNSNLNPSSNISFQNSGTTAQILPDSTNQANLSSVLLLLDSHDWGAWATLNVSATVAGQPINGHFQGDTNTDMLIPKRQIGSHVADIWKTQHNVALGTPDDDDSEIDPSSYPGCVGDGFTLYEEYRGFMENGKHIEGDPNNKDFFIENRVGADAEPGIFLFTELTALTVHKDIQPNEVKIDHPNGTVGSMLLNFNYSQGAHVTNQHGVTIISQLFYPGSPRQSLSGGVTVCTVAGVHCKPRITDGIAIQYRDEPGDLNPNNTHGSFATGGVITPASALLQYDIGVAHEFMHSVGVDHHGDNDARYTLFKFVAPGTAQNPSNVAAFEVNGLNVQLRPENGGPDLASTFWQKIQQANARCQAIVASPSQYPQDLAQACSDILQHGGVLADLDFEYSPILYVGSPHQQHSGNDQCIMRYIFANAYPSDLNNNVYYLVPAGTEPLGSTLCPSAVGTGVNDPSHLPQPRYFEAQSGRGACQSWICVSDNPKYPLVSNTN